jgi:hypothetical protein
LLEGICARWCKSHKLALGRIAFLWLVSTPIVFGTEIIVIKTDQWVVLAADSLHVRPGGTPFKACKIRQDTELFWAAAGVESDDITGFKVDTFLAEAIKMHLSVAATLDAVAPRLVGPLRRELPILKEKAPDRYSKLMRGGSVLKLIAVGVRGTQIDAYVKEFGISNGRVVPQPIKTCEPTGAQQKKCILAPETPEIKQYIETRPEVWNGDVTQIVDVLMGIGQKADPGYIGPPFSILAVVPGSTQWLRQNDCPNIKKQ